MMILMPKNITIETAENQKSGLKSHFTVNKASGLNDNKVGL